MSKKIEDYISLVNFLGQVLTDDYEIALQKVHPDGTGVIIHLVNGHVSGRSAGSPLTEQARRWVRDKAYLQNDSFINYSGTLGSDSEILIRSSTYFIKDEAGNLLGMLCVNCNITLYTTLVNSLLKNGHIPMELLDISANFNPFVNENFSDSISSILEDTIQSTHLQDKDKFSHNDRMEIITNLYHGGVFQVKGSIPEVAQRLRMAESSVYRYLAKIKETDNAIDQSD